MKTKQARKAEIRPVVIDEVPEGHIEEPLFLPTDDDGSYVENLSQEQLQIEMTRTRSDRQSRNRRGRRR